MNRRIKTFMLIFVSSIGIDQFIKYLSFEYLRPIGRVDYLGGFLKLIYATNKGAWGSFGADFPEFAKKILLIIMPVALVAWVIYYLLKNKELRHIEVISYSLIAGGGVGNLIDRILHGEVIDMFWFGFEKYRFLQTNIFNIADVVIMVGIFLLIAFEIKNKLLKNK